METVLKRLGLESLNWPERILVLALWLIGFMSLFAFPAMLLPFTWMDWIHQQLGLGELPDLPIVRYLTRSLSLFYGVFGVLSLAIARDVQQYRELVRVWTITLVIHGVCLLAIDIEAVLPAFWTLNEGPPAIVAAIVLVWCSRHVREPAQTETPQTARN